MWQKQLFLFSLRILSGTKYAIKYSFGFKWKTTRIGFPFFSMKQTSCLGFCVFWIGRYQDKKRLSAPAKIKASPVWNIYEQLKVRETLETRKWDWSLKGQVVRFDNCFSLTSISQSQKRIHNLITFRSVEFLRALGSQSGVSMWQHTLVS